MNRVHTLTFLAVLVSVVTYGIIEWRTENIAPEATKDTIEKPNFIAIELKSKIYASNGSLSHVVNAQKMEHFDSSKVTKFQLPHYTIYPNDHNEGAKLNKQSPWDLSANEAVLYKDNRVVLNDRVRLTAIDTESIIQEIHCQHLELDLKTNIISSEQTVMIQGKDFTMYGSGLSIDLNKKTMTLAEHVHTIYKKI